MKNRYVIIMAGGIGSRFWPLSRKQKPKQYLDILGRGETLIQETYRRFKKVCPEENIFVVTNVEHKEIAIEQLGISPDRVLAEPLRRNTAPCIAYGVFRIRKENPDAVIAVTPSDHLISKEDEFCNVINRAFEFVANHNALLTLGIKPDRPETGYGYIQANRKKPMPGYDKLFKVKTFTEKPNIELAKVFLESGDFYWNSGIFFWNLNSILEAFSKYLPDIYMAFEEGKDLLGTEEEESFISRTYISFKNISIDYGIMEKADNVYVIYTDIGWSDLGTWGSLYEHSAADSSGNVVISGELFTYNTFCNIVNITPGKIAVLEGLEDYIIVDSGDILMIVKKKDEQNIKYYFEDVKKKTGEKYL
ncbi:MAG TPA: mannose-1-phosphate guanylyltransferase [Bacteroidales bacterium]|nr:mannose-1-phosphate guanylyltransferase [Bacteroidales bacterium]HQG35977.1 mannose-1-phosphate guanylyltransferase [Bacteroidales bacterium]HQG52959.1 mannose-1-phosphate guanylyltransferase [Bacteroidales bacterium]HRC88548.1 mannose-1-phosphate guanylyltransferase [Bacteroidales bacterium]